MKHYLALIAVATIYGASYVIAKGVMPDIIGPSGFIVLRALGACVLFWIIYAMRYERVARKDFLRLAGCGLFGVAINQLFFFNGLSLTSAINSSIIITTSPIIVLIISAILLGERITKVKGIGVLLGFVGAVLLIYIGAKNQQAGTSVRGDIFILINALSYSIYLVMVKPLMRRYRPLTVIAWVFLFALFYVIPFGWTQFTAVDWAELSGIELRSIGFVVLFATFGVYLLNVYALSKVTASVVSSFIYLQPVMAMVFAWLFYSLGTYDSVRPHFSLPMLGATALVFIGVYLVSTKRWSISEKQSPQAR